MNNHPCELVLASQSPRRRQLLEEAGFAFTVLSVEISEIPNKNLSLPEQICDLARRKAQALIESAKLPNSKGVLVLSADTVVVLHQQILGKPTDLNESERHIRLLSGQTHSVITGLCLWYLSEPTDQGRVVCDYQETLVSFRKLSDTEITNYVQSRDGMDKAGAYGIQGEAGKFVARVDGPMDNVVGLPVALLKKLLKENGWNVHSR